MNPAILGGEPVFANRMGIVAPKLPAFEHVERQLREILLSGNLTNNSHFLREFEAECSQRLGVPNAVSVANATLGLILALKGFHLKGKVILPSFTYCATAHALHWANLEPIFVDILPDTFTLDPVAVETSITSDTSAIMPVHIFGHPCEIDELTAIAHRHGIPLLFDSAHAFGSQYKGQPIGRFGDAEVFSFHATKVFPVGEGGCVTTRDPELAHYISIARKFGDPGDENTIFPGINAKMQEFNAIIGTEMLKILDTHIANRRAYATYLIDRLGRLPGIDFQVIRPAVFTNYQNFAILVDETEFGLSRDQLFDALVAENIVTRKYFYPPLHWHEAYVEQRLTHLPITERVSSRVLCLPFYSEMTSEMLDGICRAVEGIHEYAEGIKEEIHE